MLGAREMKAVGALAQAHSADWKPIHSALLASLVAHHNRANGICCPSQRMLALYCNVSERTIRRALTQLRDWGVIRSDQPRSSDSSSFQQAQYDLLFVAANPEDTAVSSARADNFDVARRTKSASPGGQIQSSRRTNPEDTAVSSKAINLEAKKIEGEDLRAEQEQAPLLNPPKLELLESRPLAEGEWEREHEENPQLCDLRDRQALIANHLLRQPQSHLEDLQEELKSAGLTELQLRKKYPQRSVPEDAVAWEIERLRATARLVRGDARRYMQEAQVGGEFWGGAGREGLLEMASDAEETAINLEREAALLARDNLEIAAQREA